MKYNKFSKNKFILSLLISVIFLSSVVLAASPYLLVSVLDPTGDITVGKEDVFNFTASVLCVGSSTCGNVTATLMSNSVTIPVWYNSPFQVLGVNPVYSGNLSCLREMMPWQECNVTWNVKVNGESGIYNLNALFSSNEPNVDDVWSDARKVTIENEPLSEKCIDTDSGKDYYAAGTVTQARKNGVIAREDFCSGARVIEYYCSGERACVSRFRCPNGCFEGACLTQATTSCNDLQSFIRKNNRKENFDIRADVNSDGKVNNNDLEEYRKHRFDEIWCTSQLLG